jgi:F-type H+-transporting ATPase subunit b
VVVALSSSQLAARAPHVLGAAARPAASGASGSSGSSGSSQIFIVPNATFFVELFLFIVVFGVIAIFILPPIMRAMREREDRVRAGVQAGEEGRAEAQRLAGERAELLQGARAEARGLMEEASRAGDAAVEEARRRGSAEHDERLSVARPGLEAERDELRTDLQGRLGGLVVDAASQVIGEPVALEPHRALISQLAGGAATAPGQPVPGPDGTGPAGTGAGGNGTGGGAGGAGGA